MSKLSTAKVAKSILCLISKGDQFLQIDPQTEDEVFAESQKMNLSITGDRYMLQKNLVILSLIMAIHGVSLAKPTESKALSNSGSNGKQIEIIQKNSELNAFIKAFETNRHLICDPIDSASVTFKIDGATAEKKATVLITCNTPISDDTLGIAPQGANVHQVQAEGSVYDAGFFDLQKISVTRSE